MAGVTVIGNPQAAHQPGGIEAVFLAHRDELLRFLRARGAVDDAEDVLHELWLRARSAKPGPIADPLAYVYRMANNLMFDVRRAASRRQLRDHAWAELSIADVEFGDRLLLARDQLRAIEGVLAELGERTDRIFRRFRLEGASQHQIAAEMGISLSGVEKHLQKAYRALLRCKDEFDAR